VQNGYIVLPKRLNPQRVRQNLDVFSFSIDDSDMDAMAAMEQGAGIAWSVGGPTPAE